MYQKKRSLCQKVYEGVVVGKKLVDIAKEENVSVNYISKIVQLLIDEGFIKRNPPYTVLRKWEV